jgi:hypothetical protein
MMPRRIIVKRADAMEILKEIGMGAGLPLLATMGATSAMGDSYTKVPNPHVRGGKPVDMYKPVVDATDRVRQGQGSMLDHMQAYRHPGQAQAHPLYGPLHKLGPGMMGGLTNASKFMMGNGPLQGGLTGALAGAGIGLLGNAAMRWTGRSEMPYWQSALLGAGIGGATGAGGAAYRDHYTNQFNKVSKEEEKEDTREDRRSLFPAALLAGLGGAGALEISRGMGSDGTVSRAAEALNSYNPDTFGDVSKLPEGHTDLTYYQKTLSPAAQLKLFGKPVGDALVKIRSNENIMQRLGTESYTLRDAKAQEGTSGRQHYEMFSRGPVAAYMHQMKSKYHNTEVPVTLGGNPGAKYTDWMGRKFEDFVASRAGQRIHPFELTTKFMPHDDQAKLMTDFHASLSPEEQTYRRSVEDLPADQYVKQTGNYAGKAKAYLKIRDVLKQVGGTSVGASLGGVLGHAAHDYMREDDPEGGERRDWKYWLSTLGGAAAGGALGKHLSTSMMGKASAWRSPDMNMRGAQDATQSVLSMLRSAPGLSFNQRSQLMAGVGQLDPSSANQLQNILSTGGGAAVGAIVARFLMGKGLGATVVGAMLGGVIGNAVFGSNTPRTSTGNPGMVGVDFSGRRF